MALLCVWPGRRLEVLLLQNIEPSVFEDASSARSGNLGRILNRNRSRGWKSLDDQNWPFETTSPAQHDYCDGQGQGKVQKDAKVIGFSLSDFFKWIIKINFIEAKSIVRALNLIARAELKEYRHKIVIKSGQLFPFDIRISDSSFMDSIIRSFSLARWRKRTKMLAGVSLKLN